MQLQIEDLTPLPKRILTRQQMQIELPYPPTKLNPNNMHGRGWITYKAAFNDYKSDCYFAALERWNKQHRNKVKYSLPDGDFPLKLTFVWDGHRPDADNILAAAKAGIDGLAAALKINDNRFDPLVVERRALEHMSLPHPCLIVELPCQVSP